jgi:hypothetical protein
MLYQVVCYKTELINEYFSVRFVFNEMEEVVFLFPAISICAVILQCWMSAPVSLSATG